MYSETPLETNNSVPIKNCLLLWDSLNTCRRSVCTRCWNFLKLCLGLAHEELKKVCSLTITNGPQVKRPLEKVNDFS